MTTSEVIVRPNSTTFSRVTPETLGNRISINPVEERVTTVVSSNSTITGSLSFSEGVKIDCAIKGTIDFGTDDGLCILSKTATVEGDINGPRALILGTVQGDLNIEGVLVLAPSAVVIGNVSYGRLLVCDGAQISGQLNMITSRHLLPPSEVMSATPPDVRPFPRPRAHA